MKVTIRVKILILMGVAAVGVAAFGAAAVLNSLQSVNEITTQAKLIQARNLIQDFDFHVAQVWQFLTDAPLTRNQGSIDVDGKKHYDAAEADLSALNKLLVIPDQEKLVADLKAQLEAMWPVGVSMMPAYGKTRPPGTLRWTNLTTWATS